MNTPVWQWSATETARAIRSGEVTAEQVTEAHLTRLQAVNPALNAVVVDLSDQARAAARAADRARAAGAELGPLHGVPVTVKVNVDYQGQANTNGVAALSGVIAPSDAPVVANLKRAGAIVLGLTNTPEFSLRLVTDNPLYGLTKNPWDEAVTCGGSTGGGAAALAAGIGCIAHGNDIGGSLRWPAHCNGLTTIRPTLGRVPAYNESAPGERPLAAQLFSVQGPLARNVADLRLALAAMSARDMRDPWWVPAPLAGDPAPRKVGIAPIPDDMNPDPAITAMVRVAADHLADAGWQVEEIALPEVSEGWWNWYNLLMWEIRTLQEDSMRAVASADFNRVLDHYMSHAAPPDLPGYMTALAERSRHLRNWLAVLERWPVILTTVTTQPTIAPREDLVSAERVLDIFAHAGRYIGTVNHLGLPAAVVGAGLVDGLPVGVQLIASRYREDLALDAAETIEAAVGPLTGHLWAREGQAG